MGLEHGVGNEALHPAQTLGVPDNLYPLQNLHSQRLGLGLDGKHGAESGGLPPRDFIARMVRQARVVHFFDAAPGAEPTRQRHCGLLLAVQPHGEGLDAPED
ncbi:hypothetical protein SDC9_210875 [bioreactor metagenome]|uniref:Uncharacterized protein n=1 Tax=bioreactor metagenome TaxID=1076179 RepID=A0A645JHM3_9ZZZZ